MFPVTKVPLIGRCVNQALRLIVLSRIWNTDEVADGDMVLGTLPLHLAADVCAKGAVFYFLQLTQELSGRGSEYTADEMVCMGARLRRFDVSSRED